MRRWLSFLVGLALAAPLAAQRGGQPGLIVGLPTVLYGRTLSTSQLAYNVADYGCTYNPTTPTDCTASLTKAFNAAPNGSTVFLPPYTITVSAPVVWNRKVNLRGTGPSGSVINYTGAGVAFTVSPSQVANTPSMYTFSDFLLLGPGSAVAGVTGFLIGGDYFTMERVGIGAQVNGGLAPPLSGDHGFALGMTFSLTNATFFDTFYAVNFQWNTQAILWPNAAPIGENIRFVYGSAVNCRTQTSGVQLSGNAGIVFENESFDNCQLALVGGSTSTVTLVGCWFEQVNPDVASLLTMTSGFVSMVGGDMFIDGAGSGATTMINVDDAIFPGSTFSAVGVTANSQKALPFVFQQNGINVCLVGIKLQGSLTTVLSGTTTGSCIGAGSLVGVLSAQSAAANPAGAAPNFDSVIVAAATLNNTNTTMRTRAWGHVANNANAKSVRIQFAGVTVDSILVTASTANIWTSECTIQVRTLSAAAQPVMCTHFQGAGTPTSGIGLLAVVTFNPTVSNVYAVRGVQTAQNDIVQDGLTAEYFQH